MAGGFYQGRGNKFTLVTVLDVDFDTGMALCLDEQENVHQVTTRVRLGNSAWPRVGERWFITRDYGVWTFSSILGRAAPWTLTVSRDGGDEPLASELRDVMLSLGLIRENLDTFDEEIGADGYSDVNTSDTYLELMEEIEYDDDPPDGVDDVDIEQSRPDDDDDDSGGATDKRTHLPMWLSSFNCEGLVRGNRSVGRDLRRLMSTNCQLMGVQEMVGDGDKRKPLLDMMTDRGWRYSRNVDGPSREWLMIAWQPRYLTRLASGDQMLTGSNTGGVRAARWAQWVRFRHRPSGRVFTLINTHTVPPLRSLGNYQDQVEAVRAMVVTHQANGPVFITGDFNFNHRRSDRPAWSPHTIFATQDILPNYKYLPAPSGPGTRNGSLLDYVWRNNAPKADARFAEQRILRGYGSDHRPLLVKIMMRRA